jgi:small subunit ribosomal protein S4
VARYSEGLCRICRREGDKLFLKGDRCYGDKCAFSRRGYAPGQHGQARKKPTPYSTQLREKQKVRRMYGMLEKQFRLFFERANQMKGATGDNLLRLLESRLDNVAYRAGFAMNRNDGRQLVRHGHVLVNGKRVTIPSYTVKVGDVVEVTQKSAGKKRVVEASSTAERRQTVRWLECDRQKLKATVVAAPDRDDFAKIVPGQAEAEKRLIREELIVELYSK